MSEAKSALNGAEFEGFVNVQEAGLRGMISLRGDLRSAKVRSAIKKCTGLEMPSKGGITLGDDCSVAWMSPDELLILTGYDRVASDIAKLGVALKGAHCLVVNVSDARAMFRLKGNDVREVLAKLTPADMSIRAFGPGQMRRTRIAQVAGAFWMSGADTVDLICFRSVAGYTFGVLKNAARAETEVGFL